MTVERRATTRAKIRAEVEVKTEELGQITAHTRELSDTGAFIESQLLVQLEVSSVISVQAVGFPEPMPILQAEVVRIDEDGIGIKFIL